MNKISKYLSFATLTSILALGLILPAKSYADGSACKGNQELHLGDIHNEGNKGSNTESSSGSESITGKVVTVEIASDDRSRSFGLMFRNALGSDCGMLFVFPNSRYRTFTMRNTLIPLDIAFIDGDGKIKEIFTMQPGVDRYPSRVQAKYVLEVNSGWFSANGIVVDNVIQIKQNDEMKPLESID